SDSHPGGSGCELCLAHSIFHGTIPDVPTVALPESFPLDHASFAEPQVQCGAFRQALRFSRAPPA
ncbi:MAG: hypothetical protein KDD44_00140, partial [Bdellovibrionales bacterium]|nr:hypothetical protein [Bdellovibrionales bacterium]